MATQYTAGLTTGQVLTAATMNSIGAAWETWTPTITASAGAFTTTTVNLARYARINKIVILNLSVTLNNIGTATGTMRFSLPITASGANIPCVGTYVERAVTGSSGVSQLLNSTTGFCVTYNNGSSIANNYVNACFLVYEAA